MTPSSGWGGYQGSAPSTVPQRPESLGASVNPPGASTSHSDDEWKALHAVVARQSVALEQENSRRVDAEVKFARVVERLTPLISSIIARSSGPHFNQHWGEVLCKCDGHLARDIDDLLASGWQRR
jgi:hypothetical protein